MKRGVAWIVDNATGLLALGALVLVAFGIVVRGIDPLAIPDKLVSDYQQEQDRKALIGDHVKLGEELLDVEQLRAARAEFQAALALDPTDVEANLGLFKARLYEPVAGGDFDPEVAERRLAFLARTRPHDAQVRAYLGDAFARFAYYPQALAQYVEAIRLDPGMAHAYSGEGIVDQLSGHPYRALDAFVSAVRSSPQGSRYRNNLAYQLFLLRRYDEAIAQYSLVTQLDPDYMLPYYTLAAADRLIGRLNDAAERGRQLVELVTSRQARAIERNGAAWLFYAKDPRYRGVSAVPLATFAAKELYARLSLAFTEALQGDRRGMDEQIRRTAGLVPDPVEASQLMELVRSDVRLLVAAAPRYRARAAAFVQRLGAPPPPVA